MKFLIIFLTIILNAKFLVGVGGYDLCEKNNIYRQYDGKCEINANITDYTKKELPNVNAISIWITKDFDFKNWFNPKDVNKNIVNNGYIPIFIIYWLRDDTSPQFIKTHQNEYFNFLKKCDTYLKKIKGKKYIILNPEYNENGTESWSGFNKFMLKSYKILKNKNRLIGYGLGDFGDYEKTFDYENFESFKNSFKAVKYFDFIGFQEMRALTRNNISQMLNTPYRTLEFAIYLHKKYKKPTFLAYLAISSYKNKIIQEKIYKRFSQLLPIFKKEANLIGFNIFHLFDRPQQIGYFKEAEKHFGLIDNKGNKKPAYFWFLDIRD